MFYSEMQQENIGGGQGWRIVPKYHSNRCPELSRLEMTCLLGDPNLEVATALHLHFWNICHFKKRSI